MFLYFVLSCARPGAAKFIRPSFSLLKTDLFLIKVSLFHFIYFRCLQPNWRHLHCRVSSHFLRLCLWKCQTDEIPQLISPKWSVMKLSHQPECLRSLHPFRICELSTLTRDEMLWKKPIHKELNQSFEHRPTRTRQNVVNPFLHDVTVSNGVWTAAAETGQNECLINIRVQSQQSFILFLELISRGCEQADLSLVMQMWGLKLQALLESGNRTAAKLVIPGKTQSQIQCAHTR